MDWGAFAAGLGVGVYLGWGYRRLWAVVRHNLGWRDAEPAEAPPSALRVVSQHAYTSPAQIEPADRREAWDRAVKVMALWGDLCGWSERELMAQGVASRPSIIKYRAFLARQELLVVTERGRTTWVSGMDRHRFYWLIKSRMIALPYPEHEPWPLRLRWRTAQPAQRSADGAAGAEFVDSLGRRYVAAGREIVGQ